MEQKIRRFLLKKVGGPGHGDDLCESLRERPAREARVQLEDLFAEDAGRPTHCSLEARPEAFASANSRRWKWQPHLRRSLDLARRDCPVHSADKCERR